MLALANAAQSRALDENAAKQLGISSLVLMENAGRNAVNTLVQRYSGCLQQPVIIGGPGQNGGDGWVVARLLSIKGYHPIAYLVGSEEKLHGNAKINWNALHALNIEALVVNDRIKIIQSSLNKATIVVDALFGTGLTRSIDGIFADAIDLINSCSCAVVSLDVPSGIHSDTGQVMGVAVRANATITFGTLKQGLYIFPGADYTGEVTQVDIGVPAEIDSKIRLIEPRDVSVALPLRPRDTHKGDAGHVLVVAGSLGKTGAAILSAHGALRAGAGLVTIAARPDAFDTIAQRALETMTMRLPRNARDASDMILERATSMRAVVLGPGLGIDDYSRELCTALYGALKVPMVIDADALSVLSENKPIKTNAARVLTPHPGEAGRLLKRESKDVQSNRLEAVHVLATTYHAVAVLKGAGTLVSDPSGKIAICNRGTPGLAIAGAGDVLSGVLGAMLAIGIDPWTAASIGVILHAMAGELSTTSDRGTLARDVANALPLALQKCRASA